MIETRKEQIPGGLESLIEKESKPSIGIMGKSKLSLSPSNDLTFTFGYTVTTTSKTR